MILTKLNLLVNNTTNRTNLAKKLNGEASLPLRYEDLDELDMRQIVQHDYDSDYDDSEDEDLIITDCEAFKEENYWECTSYDVVNLEVNRKATQKSAPNRLLDIQKIKKVIDSNLTVCPICEKRA